MFDWWARHRRRRLEGRPFPEKWRRHLQKNVPFYAELEQKGRFEDLLKVFVWDKQFTGARGFEVTDEVKVTVAATAVRLIMGLDLSYYDRLHEIVIYPFESFKAATDEHYRLGEVHGMGGTMVLSWPAVLSGLKNPTDSVNVGFHEFAHVLDRKDGSYDGTPPLHEESHYRPWVRIMEPHFLKLRAGARLENSVLDNYGASHEAEFFAVATEAFFENPTRLKSKLPDLYQQLKQFYRAD